MKFLNRKQSLQVHLNKSAFFRDRGLSALLQNHGSRSRDLPQTGVQFADHDRGLLSWLGTTNGRLPNGFPMKSTKPATR
jgi:hypothetical protein